MIHPVNALTPKVLFKGELKNSKDSFDYRTGLALMNSGGISLAIGAVMMAVARSYTSSWKHAGLIGAGAAALAMTFIAPTFLYKAGVNSHVKTADGDVFVKDSTSKKLVNSTIEAKKNGFNAKLEAFAKNLAKKCA